MFAIFVNNANRAEIKFTRNRVVFIIAIIHNQKVNDDHSVRYYRYDGVPAVPAILLRFSDCTALRVEKSWTTTLVNYYRFHNVGLAVLFYDIHRGLSS